MMAPTIVVLDYGFGNLRSAERGLTRAGAQVRISADGTDAREADGLVVPGVGAFAACMAGLRKVSGDDIIADRLAAGRPVLGICVGHQILFARGVEHGVGTDGCGCWLGTVERLQSRVVPHMGWNLVQPPADSVLFAGVETERFYFVHSYAVRSWQPDSSPDALVTWSEYAGDHFVAAVEDGALAATQFHPEKSGEAGSRLLRNWVARL